MAATQQSNVHAAERSPLLINQTSSVECGERPIKQQQAQHSSQQQRGQAGVTQTVINLVKTCAGTGILALPYACQQGGTVLFVVGSTAVAAWNVYGVHRLVACLSLTRHLGHTPQLSHCDSGSAHDETGSDNSHNSLDVIEEQQTDAHGNNHNNNNNHHTTTRRESPPPTASTLGKVAWVAWGPMGLQVMDAMMVVLLLGIVISYLSGVISFLSDTPLTVGPLGDALIVATIMALLSMVPDLGYLSGASAVGLAVLAATFVVITGYGVASSSHLAQQHHHQAMRSTEFWPLSVTGLSRLFGVVVYGYGVVPLTYNFRDSMKEPNRLVEASFVALSIVAIGYCIAGVGLLALFPNVTGQILHELPTTGALPAVTRVAMASVCVVTAPLIIVPTGEMLEGKFQISRDPAKHLVRAGVCLVGAIVAVLLPTFVQVLSVVGCLCVGLVGFCVPPILHLRLLQLRGGALQGPVVWVDTIMLALGIATTVIGTWLTLK